jgi:large subunit ribosomal protein L15
MKQHDLSPPKGAKRPRKRIGRGDGSGHGSFSGRGMKGQNSRSGGGVRVGFEGGQLPLIRRLPRVRGFTNIFRKRYSLVNLDSLSSFPADTEVTLRLLLDTGLVRNLKDPIKVLGRGELETALIVEAHGFSAAARRKIETAGGRVKEIEQ